PNAAMTVPYTATFSSHFEIGDSKNAVIVLNILKDFEDNAVDRHPDFFSDTLTFITPEGYVIKGKAQFFGGSKQYRASFAGLKNSIESYVSLKSMEKNINRVHIQGTQEKTNREGAQQKVPFQSVWVFNKDGKVDYIREYTAKPLMQR
ncbi:MAG TPA: hypothetical protein VM888_07405, partial [Chitinophagaceae bacterium]|nr:hypothetical protein [Chitinophagaceae bacterium]